MSTQAEPCSSCDGQGCPTCRDSLEDAMRIVQEGYGIRGVYDDFQGPEDALSQLAKRVWELSASLSSIANADRKRSSPVYLINLAREALGMEKLK